MSNFSRARCIMIEFLLLLIVTLSTDQASFLSYGSDTSNEDYRVSVRCQRNAGPFRIRSDQMTKQHISLICGFLSETDFVLTELKSNNVEFPNKQGMFRTKQSTDYVVTFTSNVVMKSTTRKWTQVGKLNEIEQLVDQYPLTMFEYGIRYNNVLDSVHEVIFNSWNRGIRMTMLHSYLMGDSTHSLEFGRTVFTKGLDDAPDKSIWYQHFIHGDRNTHAVSSKENGNVAIFVRKM